MFNFNDPQGIFCVFCADVDVDVEDLRAQANASMPASYIAN